MSNVLLISPERIRKKLAGIGIRFWEFANALKDSHKVTLAVPNEDFPHPAGIEIKPYNLLNLSPLLKNMDVVILQGHISNYYFNLPQKIPTVVDLYDPFFLENITYTKYLGEHIFFDNLKTLLTQLEKGDFFLCATEKQRIFYLGMLFSIGRINPSNFFLDKEAYNLIQCIPYGVSEEEPRHMQKVLRGKIKGVSEKDKVIFFGGIYDWYNPFLVLDSLELLLRKRDDIRLVFVAHPNPDLTPQETYGKVFNFCKEKGWLNRLVFFIDWIDYDLRENYYLESDVAISIHHPSLEASLSFRTRMLDYLWSGLPVITNEGGELSEIIGKNKVGFVLKDRSAEGLALLLEKILDDTQLLKDISRKGMELVRRHFLWKDVVKPLNDFCKNPKWDDTKEKYNVLKNGQLKGIKRKVLHTLSQEGFISLCIKAWRKIRRR